MKILSRDIKIKQDVAFGEMVTEQFFVQSKKYVFNLHFVYSFKYGLTIRAFSIFHGKTSRIIGVCDCDITKKSVRKAIADDEQWRFNCSDISRINDMKKCLNMLVNEIFDKAQVQVILSGI